MKVLCAIDGSRHSRWALELLPRLCRASDSSLLLVHAVDVRWFRVSKGLGTQARDAMRHALELAELGGRKLLESAKLKVTAEWGRVESKLLLGRPTEVIARAAARQRMDLIVIGSRGLTELRPMLLGTVSRELLMKAPCLVMVVKKLVTALTRIIVLRMVPGSRGTL
jgi:nucleotide-binding universal stress UspA family protein